MRQDSTYTDLNPTDLERIMREARDLRGRTMRKGSARLWRRLRTMMAPQSSRRWPEIHRAA
ncbi:MAG: hypothetical protein U5L11_09305 [Arhodomonas sp.]|nr:hypothetical protein [Arhodomonas sp.]